MKSGGLMSWGDIYIIHTFSVFSTSVFNRVLKCSSPTATVNFCHLTNHNLFIFHCDILSKYFHFHSFIIPNSGFHMIKLILLSFQCVLAATIAASVVGFAELYVLVQTMEGEQGCVMYLMSCLSWHPFVMFFIIFL